MKRSTVLLSVAIIVLLALLLGFAYVMVTNCDCVDMNSVSATRQAIEATNQLVEAWITGTVAAITATAEAVH